MVGLLVNMGYSVIKATELLIRNNVSRLYVTHCMYFIRLHVYYYYYDDDNNNSKNTSSRVIRINVLDNSISEHAAFVRFNSVLSHVKLLFLGHSTLWNILIKVHVN